MRHALLHCAHVQMIDDKAIASAWDCLLARTEAALPFWIQPPNQCRITTSKSNLPSFNHVSAISPPAVILSPRALARKGHDSFRYFFPSIATSSYVNWLYEVWIGSCLPFRFCCLSRLFFRLPKVFKTCSKIETKIQEVFKIEGS